MADRITQKDLEYLVKRINELTGSPVEQHSKDETGRYKSNPGNYHISGAYGGVALERICNEGGGVQRISTGGYGTKRQLYTWMIAYLAGMENNKTK